MSKPYAGIKPACGNNDSESESIKIEIRSEFRDNRGQWKPFGDWDDDEYFPVPEVLDEP
ncbi:hypothetical protein [Cohnella abietis]|uniref:Uncharacterized protein n=1 Tax=Cohnella abietis TaxID=2507935 RepID=A0A3T1DCU2_9BACL|nr:hypothetical protein [Cohnella abietis]BBI35778.1 hypothetical protein KCTCHS21_51770 [Cohnella abietis]